MRGKSLQVLVQNSVAEELQLMLLFVAAMMAPQLQKIYARPQSHPQLALATQSPALLNTATLGKLVRGLFARKLAAAEHKHARPIANAMMECTFPKTIARLRNLPCNNLAIWRLALQTAERSHKLKP